MVCDSLFPVPAKVVAKIKAKEFVDMAEILRDNTELERRQMNEVMPSTARLSRREVPDLLSWVVCFSTFASVVSSLDPEKTKQLWAYLATVVREARRHGGKGWQTYDSMFRQLAAGASTVDWSVLNASLYDNHLYRSGKRSESHMPALYGDRSHIYFLCLSTPSKAL